MDTVTKKYIETVQVSDIPWHRLTTSYGRGTDFPNQFDVLWKMDSIEAVDVAGEDIALNIEQNKVAHYLAEQLVELFTVIVECIRDGLLLEHADPLPCFEDMLNEEYLWSEEYDEDEDVLRYEEEDVFPDDLFFSFYYYSLQVLLLCKPLLNKANEGEANLLELLTEIDH